MPPKLILLLFLILPQKSKDEQIFEDLLKHAPQENQPKLMIYFAKQLLGKPYVGHTLEINKNEQLVINLREFDCVTLIENAWALAMTKHSKKPDFQTFQENLQKIRYRNGKIKGYPSRLHYFSDWLYENEKAGWLKSGGKEFGGVLCEGKVGFMSKNANKYLQLADKQALAEIILQEKNINLRQYEYVPKAMVAQMEYQIEEGDIISICTNIAGLDFSHQGIAIKQNGKTHLLHASSDYKKVIISVQPLADYLAKNKTQTGIVISRMIEFLND